MPRQLFRFLVSLGLITATLLATAADVPRELVAFQPHSGTPVFTGAGPGHWDAKIRERGWIMVDAPAKPGDAPLFRLWYTGYDGTREGIKQLGYATSPDGVNWTRHPSNPIHSGDWVEDMMIVKQDSTYFMFAEGRDDQAQLLKSADGLRWTRVGPLDVRKENGQPIAAGPFGTPVGWFEDGVWHLFYERRDAGVWHATSRDMRVWQHVDDLPVLLPGHGEYEQDLIAMNQIVKHGGKYYAYYHGSKQGSGLWATCIAVSDNLNDWRKYDRNPLFPVAANKSSGILVLSGQRRLLYTMHDKVQLHVLTEAQ